MKIYCVSANPNFSDKQLKQLNDLGNFKIIKTVKDSNAKLISRVKDAEILLVSPSGIDKLTKDFFRSLNKLRYISLLSVGYEWVDIKSAENLSIPISNIKGANAESVAEHIFGMVLNLTKRISEYDRAIRVGEELDYRNFKGIEIYNKTIGIIGTGDIGKKVARIARSFKMNIIGYNKSLKEVKNINIVDLNFLLKYSDIIVLSLPLNNQTYNFLSVSEFKKIHKGTFLINCAREELVNKTAVLDAIKNKIISGYGIDMNNMQKLDLNDPYLKEPNILITGHNAAATDNAEKNTFDSAISNTLSFLKGEPKNLITKI